MKQLLQEIVNYLVTRPWQEVNGLIAKLGQQLQQIEMQEKVAKDVVKPQVRSDIPTEKDIEKAIKIAKK